MSRRCEQLAFEFVARNASIAVCPSVSTEATGSRLSSTSPSKPRCREFDQYVAVDDVLSKELGPLYLRADNFSRPRRRRRRSARVVDEPVRFAFCREPFVSRRRPVRLANSSRFGTVPSTVLFHSTRCSVRRPNAFGNSSRRRPVRESSCRAFVLSRTRFVSRRYCSLDGRVRRRLCRSLVLSRSEDAPGSDLNRHLVRGTVRGLLD